MLFKSITTSRLLLVGSLCVLLSACGLDDKPTLQTDSGSNNSGSDNSGSDNSGSDNSGSDNSGSGGASKPKVISALREDINYPLYEVGDHYEREWNYGGTSYTTYACSKSLAFDESAKCNLLRITVTVDDFVYVGGLSESNAITVDYALTDKNGKDVSKILKDPTKVKGTIKLYKDHSQPKMVFPFKSDGESNGDWNLTFTLSNPSAGIKLQTASVTDIIVHDNSGSDNSGNSGAQTATTPKINDTGVTYSAGVLQGSNGTTCADNSKQDCSTGRDVTYPNSANGHAGFDFTKLDEKGAELANTAEEWACVKDNTTGLVWERKTYAKLPESGEDDKRGLRDSQWDYVYYDESQGLGKKENPEDDWTKCGGIGNCTTATYLAKLNEMQLCGKSNWQVPSKAELFDVINLNSSDPEVVMQAQAGWLMSIYSVPADETDPNLVDTRYKRVRSSYWTRTVTAEATQRDGYSGPYTVKFDRVWTMLPDGSFNVADPHSSYAKSSLIAVSK
ncbi:MAG: hypothetical protein CR991_10155 [Proteobacteria bacterium]|nr:MAG: hypothetical protein CR991_10155 [Pseudomonadota bacterium]